MYISDTVASPPDLFPLNSPGSVSPALLLRLPYIPLPPPSRCSTADVQNFKYVTLGIPHDDVSKTVVISCWGRWSRFNLRYLSLLSLIYSRFQLVPDPPRVVFVFSRWSHVPSSHVHTLRRALSSPANATVFPIPSSAILVLPLQKQQEHALLACSFDVHVDTLPVGGHVTVGDALAGGSNVVSVGGEGMCGRYAASLGVHLGCNRCSRSGSGSGVFVAIDDDNAADAIVALALRNSAQRQKLNLWYDYSHDQQQLRYWHQLEAGIKMALDQQYRVQQRRQKLLYSTVVANEQ